MNEYAFRAAAQDWPQGIEMLLALGVLAQDEGGALYATEGGSWRFLGPIHRVPTGEYDEEGNEIMGPVLDDKGGVYWHANLDTPLDVKALAEAAAAENPEIAAALAELDRWILTDEDGVARLPNHPYEVIWR